MMEKLTLELNVEAVDMLCRALEQFIEYSFEDYEVFEECLENTSNDAYCKTIENDMNYIKRELLEFIELYSSISKNETQIQDYQDRLNALR